MLNEDEGAYYLEFFSQNLVVSALLSLFLAPIVPGWIAQYFLVAAVSVAAVTGLLFIWVRTKFLKMAQEGESTSLVQTLISEDASTMFRVVGSTTLIILVAILWLGFAKMLWVFESFFVLFAGIHIATSVVCAFIELIAIRGEIDDLTNCVYGAQPDNDGEEADGP